MTSSPIPPEIFKAYDIRGLYPSEINEEVARQIGRGFVAYLGAKRIGVSRDMRISSPGIAAAFIQGAREQGADVVANSPEEFRAFIREETARLAGVIRNSNIQLD